MNQKNLLRISILVLIELRDNPHNNLEISVLQKIEYAISCLEKYEKEKKEVNINEILDILGFVLQNLPTIVEIAKRISGK